MSFSVLPIAVIAPPFGAPSPGSDAEAGFDALLAAFTGEAAAPQGEPPKTPAADGGQAKANPPEALLVVSDEAEPPSPEGPGEDPTAGLAAAAALVVDAIVPPAPLSAPAGATAAATAPPEGLPTDMVAAPAAAPRSTGPAGQVHAELGARLAATDEAGSTAESEPPVAATVETSPAGDETETEAKTPQPVDSARAAASLQTPAAAARVPLADRTAQLPLPGQAPPPTAAPALETAPIPAPVAETEAATPAIQPPASAPLMAAAAAANPVVVQAVARPPAEAKPAAPASEKGQPNTGGVGAAKPETFALFAEDGARAVSPPAGVASRMAGQAGGEIEAAPAGAAPEPVEIEAAEPTPAGTASSGARADEAARPGAERPQATSATLADLAAQVARKLQARSSHFEIQLQPEGLGRVDVRVDIDAQGRLTAALSFDNPQAASDLRQRAGELQRTLEQAGFDLSGGLSFQSPDDRRGAFAEDRRDQQGGSARAFASALDVAESADAPVAVRAYGRRPSDQGVDVRI